MIKVKNMSSGCAFFSTLIAIYGIVAWVVNLVKLINCDWVLSESIKHEVIHVIGLIPGASMITCWF
jgi:hypothetical protein